MAYQEYYDLYLLAQENSEAQYYVISFDVINSLSLSLKQSDILVDNIIFIMKYVYNKLLEKEKELNKQVLIHDERFHTHWDIRVPKSRNYEDPSILGDNFAFTVLRDTVTKEEIVNWVYECKKELNMEEDFHITDGYYETNEYSERTTKFYRGYCLQILERIHKPEIQKELKRVKKMIKK